MFVLMLDSRLCCGAGLSLDMKNKSFVVIALLSSLHDRKPINSVNSVTVAMLEMSLLGDGFSLTAFYIPLSLEERLVFK